MINRISFIKMLATWSPLIICLIFLLSLGGCATLEQYDPEGQAAEARLKARKSEIDAALESWRQEFRQFSTEAATLTQEITLLRNHPGWTGMEQIIKAAPSIQYLEGQDAAERKTLVAIAEWSLKWNARGESMHTKYLTLAERSRELEKQRVSLLSRWDSLWKQSSSTQATLLALALLKSRAGVDLAPKLLETVSKANKDIDIKTKSALNSYTIDSLGLYVRRFP